MFCFTQYSIHFSCSSSSRRRRLFSSPYFFFFSRLLCVVFLFSLFIYISIFAKTSTIFCVWYSFQMPDTHTQHILIDTVGTSVRRKFKFGKQTKNWGKKGMVYRKKLALSFHAHISQRTIFTLKYVQIHYWTGFHWKESIRSKYDVANGIFL